MNSITDYIVSYEEHYDGIEQHFCPVKRLVPGKQVPFKPDKSLREPSINCKSVSDTEVVLEYVGYIGGGNLGLQKIEFVLNSENTIWTCRFNGASRWVQILKPDKPANK